MRTVIDATPVSSRTVGPAKEPEPRSRWAEAVARLKRRLIVMTVVLAAVGIFVVVAWIGLILLLALLGTAAILATYAFVRTRFGGRRGGPPARR